MLNQSSDKELKRKNDARVGSELIKNSVATNVTNKSNDERLRELIARAQNANRPASSADCDCGQNHHDGAAAGSCGHDHAHHHNQSKRSHDGCGCGHDHAHHHNHDESGRRHEGCGCGHDHGRIENSMDTDWDISGVAPDQAQLLLSFVVSLDGVKAAEQQSDILRVVHRPEALTAIETALQRHGFKIRRKGSDGKETAQIRIMQMDCPTEEGLIRKKLATIEGVGGLQFNLMNRILTVSYPPGTLPQIVKAIESLDYTPEVLEDNERPKLSEFEPTVIPWWKYILGIVIAAASEITELMSLNEYLSLALAIAAISLVGLGTFKKGFIAIRNLNFNMNALMTVAVTGAVLIGSWPEAAMVMVLFELSEAIEQLSLDKARGAIRSLLSLAPQNARVLRNGQYVEINASEVAVGDIIRIMPGERLPVDGLILKGRSSVDQSPITGESMPVDKGPEDKVFAGTVNQNGELIYRAESSVEDSMPARIIAAIESAQSSRAPTQRFVDQFAKVYTPSVFAIALACALLPPLLFQQSWTEWIYKALTLLVIACPCALVISTPVTIVSGLAAAARRGILIKGGVYLEKGRTLKRMAFDKTGTVTEGKPAVFVFETADQEINQDRDQEIHRDIDQEIHQEVDQASDKKTLLSLAGALAVRNDHPVSKAIAELAFKESISSASFPEVHGFSAMPGHGVTGEIEGIEYYLGNIKGLARYGLQTQVVNDTVSALADEGYSPVVFASSERVLAYFGVADSVKPTSAQALRLLKELGIQTVMLTGDNEKTAKSVARKVGVDRVEGNLLPEDKQSLVHRMAQENPVGMVGDGINDAPALARADIGFAMGAAGTDTAIETADVALMDDDLRKLPEFIRLSRKTYSLLLQNIFIALGIKSLFFILTLIGIGTMWMAVFADTGTCLIVVANGMRLLRWRG